jgi:hypothetical protein
MKFLVVGSPSRDVRRSGHTIIVDVDLEDHQLFAPELAQADLSPMVLGSVKSGVFSPTSTAVATPAAPSTPISSRPNHNGLHMCFASICISFPQPWAELGLFG